MERTSDVLTMPPTPLELELLRDLALAEDDHGLRVAVGVANAGLRLNGAPIPRHQSEAVQFAISQCIDAIDRWRATPTSKLGRAHIVDLATCAMRAFDHHARQICYLAMRRPADHGTSEQEQAVAMCLAAWNARAARLADQLAQAS